MSKRIRNLFLITLASGISITIYLLYSARYFESGFPLDDAWIHQTYARSLGETGVWTFLPGRPSAGSTSPLWTGLLSIGYVLRINPIIFSSLIGLATLTGLGLVFQSVAGNYQKPYPFPWFGILIVFEWHLVWAALSGMETLLFALVVLGVLAPLMMGKKPQPYYGLLIGVAVWIRPEGITLLIPILLMILMDRDVWKHKIKLAGMILAGFALVVGPYILLNQALSGSLWPNTYYAKQFEYTALLAEPLTTRLWNMILPVLTGAGLLLLPGLIWFIIISLRAKQWGKLLTVLWWLGFVGIYALRMPVAYQHGRYMIPAMPVFMLAGLLGTISIIQELKVTRQGWIVSRALLASTGLILAAFWVLGAGAYARDVAIIQSEMVAASRWVETNTDPSARIAAHDIGALGYYSGREILDLAGLIDPEVIPFIRSETEIATYLQRSQADYLVTFPGWYISLTKEKIPVYCSIARFAHDAGGENMCVYAWERSSP